MADASRRLDIIISASDQASQKIKNVASSTNYLNGVTSKLGGFLKGAAVAGGIATVAFGTLATKLAFSAARVEELGFALHAIAKANNIAVDSADATVQMLRKYNIAHDKALQITSLFIQSQLDLADATKLANVAKDLAVISGQDSSEATRTLTEAIASQEVMLLRQYGLVTTTAQVFDNYALKLGIASTELDETQKKQAFLNYILEQGEKVTGTYDAAMGSVSKRFRSLTGRIIPDLLAELGKIFTPALTVLVDAFTTQIEELSQWLIDNKDTVAEWGEKLKKAAEKVVDAMKELKDFIFDEVIPKLKEMKEWFEKNQFAMDMLKGFIMGVLIVALIALATTIWTVTIPALVAMAVAFAPFVIAGGIFAAVYAFMNWLSKKTTGFTLLEQLTAAVELVKMKFQDFIGWVDKMLEKIEKFLGKADKAKKVGSGSGGGGGGSFQHGGFINAPFGQAVPAILHGGERVVPRTGVDVNSGGGVGAVNLNFTGPIRMDSEERVNDLARRIIDLLGRQNELAGKGLAI